MNRFCNKEISNLYNDKATYHQVYSKQKHSLYIGL